VGTGGKVVINESRREGEIAPRRSLRVLDRASARELARESASRAKENPSDRRAIVSGSRAGLRAEAEEGRGRRGRAPVSDCSSGCRRAASVSFPREDAQPTSPK